MSWLVIYLTVAFVGMIFVFAAFKIGGDADVTAPALQPGDQVEPREVVTAIEPTVDYSLYPSSRLAPDLDVEAISASSSHREH
jgi:hypothetical protein